MWRWNLAKWPPGLNRRERVLRSERCSADDGRGALPHGAQLIAGQVHLHGQSPRHVKIAYTSFAIAAGADFIKTSTGKINPAATMEVTLVMLHAIRDHYLKTGQMIAIAGRRHPQEQGGATT